MTKPGGSPLLHLPVAYAVAVALRDAGLAPDDIAARLGLPPESMPALLELADAKLASLRRPAQPDADHPGSIRG